MQEGFFNTVGRTVAVCIRDTVYADPKNWPKMEELATAFNADSIFDTQSWFTSFRASELANGLT